jgi:hypothetical protein
VRKLVLGSIASVLASLLAGCGGIKSPDLFLITRTGSGAHARLTMLVNEEGGIRCNGSKELKLADLQIVKARQIQEELQEPSSEHLLLAPRPGSVLEYRVRDENGEVRFADNSVGQPKVLRELELFVVEAAQQICHLPE